MSMNELHAFLGFSISVFIQELMDMEIKMTLARCYGSAGRYVVIAWLQL
jgi:hypothetical protein